MGEPLHALAFFFLKTTHHIPTFSSLLGCGKARDGPPAGGLEIV